MKKILLILSLLSLFLTDISAQKNIKTFIFGHSLIHHEIQLNETPSQETSVPHWFHFLAQEAGHDYAIGGQYGLLQQHINLPPDSQWWFDHAPGAWDAENEPFSNANFTNILITPGNFMQWQPPTENYPSDDISPVSATNTIFDWCIEQEDSLTFYIYENWPDMAPYLANGFPPTASEWVTYNNYLNGDFHDWFLEYHDLIDENFPNACVRMIPVGPIISKLLQEAPYNQIDLTELYEDDAPHGRPTTYFLASLITYMAMYEEKALPTYEVESIIDSVIADNYQAVVDFIWIELSNFTYNDKSNSRVFCATPIISQTNKIDEIDISILPNPTKGNIRIEGIFDHHIVDVYAMDGKVLQFSTSISSEENKINLNGLTNGIYLLVGKNEFNRILYRKKVVKL